MKKTPRQLKSKDVPKLRNFLLKKQEGKCLICDKKTDHPCLDHSHIKRVKGTGLIRGVLCSRCNIFIAKSENNCVRYGISQEDLPTILRSCANYLEKPHLPYIHPSEAPKPKKLMKSSYNKLVKTHLKNLMKPNFYGNGHVPKLPDFPKSGKLTKPLEKMYELYELKPEFYK